MNNDSPDVEERVAAFWTEHSVTAHFEFDTREQSLDYLAWRNNQYPGYIDLMPIAGHDGKRILDYGCGVGHDVVGFVELSNDTEVIGVDYSSSSIEEAKARLKLHGRHADFRTIKPHEWPLPFADDTFDLIHCSRVLHHTSDPQRVLKEFYRLLKPGGRAQIMIYNHDSVWMHLYVAYIKRIEEGTFSDLSLELAFARTTDSEDCPIARPYHAGEFAQLCTGAGFTIRSTGSAISVWELSLLQKRFAAMMDLRMPRESREFLRTLTFDALGRPLQNGAVAGIDLCFSLEKPLIVRRSSQQAVSRTSAALSAPMLGMTGVKSPVFWFDSVVMLTWSNWHTEPRSNRYHYATRFARHVPVYFVQADALPGVISFEPLEGNGITIVHVSQIYDQEQALLLDRALKERDVHRPLQWIYNVYFERYIKLSTPRLRVYHATEDYVTPTAGLQAAGSELIHPITRVLPDVDLLVAVTEGVEAAYRTHAGYCGRSVVLRNGCDAAFWEASGASQHKSPDGGSKVALYQGGINRRLDFSLLDAITALAPDWQFWFCGDTHDGGEGWQELSKKSNVHWFGRVSIEEIAELSRQSTIGLIPFKQDPLIERSLPLKAFEYVACGLPVVSVPIAALAERKDLFAIETTAEGFVKAMERLAPLRTDAALLEIRRQAAVAESYDGRFESALAALDSVMRGKPQGSASLNILLLYDEGSAIVRTVYEHINAFLNHSRHRYYLMSATRLSVADAATHQYDFSSFDAVVIHYSVRVSVPQHITADIADAVKRYRGPKLLFIQDEYENTETARQWIERLGVDSVFTNIPLDSVPAIYDRARFPHVDFVSTLTGYIPEDPGLDQYALPLSQRSVMLGYRGRELPHHYGDLGHDKFRIGRDVRELCRARGITCDIEVDHASRLNGTDWYRFVGSCRALLGTESGSNVFDFDGSLKILAESHKNLSYEEFRERFLSGVDSGVRMNQVSPKIFEAIRLRTALVLFEGEYSGVVEAGKHYIALKHDYSNIDDVLASLADIEFLRELTDLAYRDIVESDRYSYRTFVQDCDRYLDARVGEQGRARVVNVPVSAIPAEKISQLAPSPAFPASVAAALNLSGRVHADQALPVARAQEFAVPRAAPFPDRSAPRVSMVRRAWRLLPEGVRAMVVRVTKAGVTRVSTQPAESLTRRVGRVVMRNLPPSIAARLRSWL